MQNKKIRKMILAAMFLALAYVLPFFTGSIPQIGNMLCPMHLPVFLCGFVCGPLYGLIVGLVAPLLRSLTLGMPPIVPTGLAMAFELATYGGIAGLLYKFLPKKVYSIYISLAVSMIFGRVVWGVVRLCLAGVMETQFGFSAFIAGAITQAVPGIIVQIILVPVLVLVWEKYMKRKNKE